MLKYHIETVTVGSGGAASITFSAIPATFTDLVVVLSARTNNEPDSNGYGVAQISFNSSTTNHTNRRLLGNGANVQSFGDTTRNILVSGSNNTANTFGNAALYVPNYRSSVAKSYSIDSVTESNAASNVWQVIAAGLWNDTSAITSLSLTALSGLFVQHSSASLYGIKRGSDGKTETASGGAISFSGGYTIHTFQSSGTFVANRDLDVEYLVVAGGGGGELGIAGQYYGPGGGGGSAKTAVTRVSAGISYPVTVGAGGARNADGTDSIFLAAYAGKGRVGVGRVGGSNDDFVGFNPGGGSFGGGGAGAANSATAFTGANGLVSLVSGFSTYYGGGGGGGGIGAAGGLGGGGSGENDPSAAATNGGTNTGGGGGGSGTFTGRPPGLGGSGIVIIRYLTPA